MVKKNALTNVYMYKVSLKIYFLCTKGHFFMRTILLTFILPFNIRDVLKYNFIT